MALSSRERLIRNLLILAVAAWVFDQFVLASYLEKRQELVTEYESASHDVDQAVATIKRQGELRDVVGAMGDSLAADPSIVEARLLHLAQDWEQKANISNASFQRLSAGAENGFTRLTFEISGEGSMYAIAGFLFEVEKSPISLRVDSTNIQPKNETGAIVDIHLTVSTICHGNLAASTRPTALLPLPVLMWRAGVGVANVSGRPAPALTLPLSTGGGDISESPTTSIVAQAENRGGHG